MPLQWSEGFTHAKRQGDAEGMADAPTEEALEEGEEQEGGSGRKPGKFATILVALVGLGGGGGAGYATLGGTVGPILAERAQNGGGGGGGHGAEDGPSPIHVIDNLVVNPARSSASRLLLVSIAVETVDPELSAVVAEHEFEIRAALIMVLGSKTTEELADIQNRDTIVREIRDAVVEILGSDVVEHVFIPQFVIQ